MYPGESCDMDLRPEMDLMTHGKGHVTDKSSGHVTEIWSRSWGGGISTVPYHCGGWSEEVNSCILISYMVYL